MLCGNSPTPSESSVPCWDIPASVLMLCLIFSIGSQKMRPEKYENMGDLLMKQLVSGRSNEASFDPVPKVNHVVCV